MVDGTGRREGSYYHCMLGLERETRLELATLCLGSRCSTTEVRMRMLLAS